jgi:hypothetical protein
MDEQGKINVDLAPKDVLLRLPPLSGATALVDAIVAANIVVKEDLLLFEGMTPQLYDQLKDYVTACGLGLVNINTASSEVLAALGMDADLINKIQIYRAGADGIEGTQDDGVFLALDEIIPVLEKNYGLVAVQQQTLQNLMTIGQLAVTSDYVRFEVTVKKGVKTLGFFNIVVSLGEQRIVSWQEQGSEPVSAKTDKKQE